jgi:hypothetical protein
MRLYCSVKFFPTMEMGRARERMPGCVCVCVCVWVWVGGCECVCEGLRWGKGGERGRAVEDVCVCVYVCACVLNRWS